jgi:SAM-dependent methyltransferase
MDRQVGAALCEDVQMDPQQKQTADTFDTYKHTYSSTVNDAIAFTGFTVDFFTKVKADYIVDIAARQFLGRKDISVLDIGCGVGNYHKLLSPSFARLAGVDVSSECIATARSRNVDVEYKSYDGLTLPYGSGSFDLAFTICVMHHVPPSQWQNFAAEMHRVVRPGGLALVFEHNPLNPLTMRAVNNCPFDDDAVLLRSGRTRKLLQDAGFSGVKTRFILSVPAKNKLLRSFDRLFSWAPFGAQYYVSGERI